MPRFLGARRSLVRSLLLTLTVGGALLKTLDCLVESFVTPVVHRSLESLVPACRRDHTCMRALPPLWEAVWGSPALKPGEPGTPIGTNDFLQGLKAGIEEQLLDQEPAEGIPVSSMQTDSNGNIFEMLRDNYDRYGGIYKTRLSVASGINTVDPVIIKHILTNRGAYDKGVLGVVSEDIFGRGLISAVDRDLWIARRKVVSPGFHKRWLKTLAAQFVRCTSTAFESLDESACFGEIVDMENVYLNIGLDIVGKAVFNFDFGTAGAKQSQQQSPIAGAVYRVLKETGYRAANPALLALAQFPAEASAFLPEAREYRQSLERLNAVLDEAIANALKTGSAGMDIEELQNRDLDTAEDQSLLRFLLDARGQDATSAQLKDDLRTLLIAGHETVASVMTWATFELTRRPEIVAKIRQELDQVLGDRDPTYEDVQQLDYLRLVITETLRMYPAPVVLMRRALEEDELPSDSEFGSVHLQRGSLILLQIAMLHRHPAIYQDPDEFRPERWTKPFGPNASIPGWKGFDPQRVSGLSPNEMSTDFAFIPFGAGEFKCIGDQFAMMEAAIVLAMLVRRYDFTPMASSMDEVGIDIAATIHTKKGLLMRVRKRES